LSVPPGSPTIWWARVAHCPQEEQSVAWLIFDRENERPIDPQDDQPASASAVGQGDAIDLFRQLGDEQKAGRCMLNLASLADGSGDLDGAGHLYQECLTTADAIADRWGVAAAINNLGNVALAR